MARLEKLSIVLEEQFFRDENAKKLDKLREKQSRAAIKESLRLESGMTDEGVLDKLVDLGISAETIHALSLVPLVVVAWADGKMQDNERHAIMHGAESKGIDKNSSSYDLLSNWLKTKPGDELFDAWESYIQALLSHLTSQQREILAAQVVDRARDVAKSAGGFLGIASISDDEDQVLDRLSAAFRPQS